MTYPIIAKAKLVGYTQPSEEFKGEFNSVQDLVAYCARVSNPENQMNHETSERLINYLLKHKHFSPFEMASITLEIETTRDIARQLIRHQLKVQEFSQRYADPTSSLGFVLREARLQDQKNRQNSLEVQDLTLQEDWDAVQKHVIDTAKAAYDWAISKGIAKEQARCVLPEGNTISRLYVHSTIRNFIHYIELRKANGTQKEHQLLALAIAEAISKVFKLPSAS
jgi:thymidylate synthase (FAD)